jgi:P27 family predicted phage terminase small subunit
MGKKPTPTALRLVRGLRVINPKEPRLPAKLPTAPLHLSDEAVEEWNRVVGDLYQAGVVRTTDRAALAAYCQAYGRWVVAEKALRTMADRDPSGGGAMMITTKSGNVIQNPILGAANKSMADMVRYASELGLTPAARSRIQAERPEDDDDPGAKYFS